MGQQKTGRPRLSDYEETESHSLTAPRSVWEKLAEVGEGNWSAGLRLLIRRLAASEKYSFADEE